MVSVSKKRFNTSSIPHTCPKWLIKQWESEGMPEDWIDSHKKMAGHLADYALQMWKQRFSGTFSQSPLRDVLNRSEMLRQSGCLLYAGSKAGGLGVVIMAASLKDFRLLLNKKKQLAYRLKSIDKKVGFLIIEFGSYALTTILATGKAVPTIIVEVE